jgi:probable rRNA maturation factor
VSVSVDVQIASEMPVVPSAEQFIVWASVVLSDAEGDVELSVRVVDESESSELNQAYRNIAGPTNVLAFPFEAPDHVPVPLLGDVVICAPVVCREALDQNKPADAHFAHMIVHGTLHLLGYDHRAEAPAARMESEERRVLAALGFPDPYDSPEAG